MIRVGTSGYNYPEWRGAFYPADLPAGRMLAFYAERFTSVEVNYTFYRMPTPALTAGWARATPDGFVFALKAPRRITHDRRLRDVGGFDYTAEERAFAEKIRATLGADLPPQTRRSNVIVSGLDLPATMLRIFPQQP